MYDRLYDLLFTGYFYTHSIGPAAKKETINKFESIIKLGGLYSKSKLKDMGINVSGKVNGNIRITKEDSISLFDPYRVSFEQFLKHQKNYRLDLNDITFLVDTESINKRGKRHDFDFTEVVVKDKISIDEIYGILIPDNEEILNQIVKILEESNIDLPIFNIYGEEINIKNILK